ncbi:HlyD family secretion protein [Vibrio algivorus]|uniref:HlyD family efflux transporter periplasmic adaptor subunit n=1 Tax=Vibrio algivorus TaxID=1667024 RepID=A0A557PB34_9VIBR|nr:HlyD family efflux transporter periplasmic adaptor subunit [Vibrio algivorus]TVO37859.1 HlyD family efflux transporter periplasmic adaptor subunit [Vibrio algivorus]
MVKRIGAFVIVILGGLISGCSPQDSTQASGTLERERISLLSTASEIIIELPAKEGSKVEKGQLLLQLDNKNQKAILAKARAELAQAKANLTKMSNGERVEDIDAAKANLANAKAKLIDAQKHYTRMSELLGKKLVSISERDNALAERDATKATYDSAYQTWQKLTKGNRVEDIESAQAQLAAAKAEVVLQRHKLDELSIIATRDGILDSLPYHLGERVPDRAVVAIVQANAKPYARVYIPEPYKHKIHAGVSLNVHIDGVGEAMKGTVRWISVEPAFTPYRTMTEEDRSRLVYLTEIDLPEAANSLPAGIPLQVDLEGI